MKSIIPNFINRIMIYFKILIIFKSGSAIGDQLLLTGLVRLIKEKYDYKIILFLNYKEFFHYNPRVYKVFKLNNSSLISKIFLFILRRINCERIIEFLPQKKNEKGKHFSYFYNSKMHLAEITSAHFNLNLNFKDFKNEIYFSEKEIEMFRQKIKLPHEFALIQSTSKQTFTKNKEWKVEGMQSIVKFFQKIHWIQIGKKEEPILKDCEKMPDLNFRELAYVISKCKFLVSYEGLFNHLASCFDKKNFLIHTGFLSVEFSHYKNNIVVENNKNIKCFPCYDFYCSSHKRSLNNNLTNEYVINIIQKNL